MATHTDLGFEHVYEPGTSGWTLLLLHGTGGDEHDLVPLGRQLAPNAALLSPRGKVLENGMPRFFRRLAVGRLDIPDLMARTEELSEFVAAASHEYDLDPTRIIALGLSNGANIAVSVLFRHPELLRGAALLRPMLPYEHEQPPTFTKTDVLIDAGEGDPFSSPEQTSRLADILRAGGARVTLHTEPRAGHALTQNDLAQTARWLSTVTRGHTAPSA
jgi:phospholipase/carboxylesterase